MKKTNPFTLTFGKKPAEYIARYENTEAVISTFEAEIPVSQSYLIEGIRGSGKTVLMTTIAAELSSGEEWIVVDLNSTRDLVTDLAVRLSDACKKLPDLRHEGFSISAFGFGVGLNRENTYHDQISVIEEILLSLKKKKKKILITVDEVVHGENMRFFASEFQILLRKEYPVFLLMTGLYENIYAIQNDPALTFLLRTPKIRLEPLSMHQITRQYQEIFQIDFEDAKKMAYLTKGYAFAFQAFGMLYYEYREQESTERILLRLDDILDDFVYKKIWEGLSAQERNIVRSIPDNPVRVREVCKALSMTSAVFSRYRDRLLRRGLLAAPQHGYIALTLPRFSDVIKSYM